MTLRNARRDRLRAALADALRPLGDPVEIQAMASRILCQHLDANRVHYGEITHDQQFGIVQADYHQGVPSAVGRYHLDDYGPTVMAEIRAGRTLIVSDVATDPRLTSGEKLATAALDIGAYVIVPLIKTGRAVALLTAHHKAPREWTPEDVLLIEQTAERTWDAVERARAETALQASEARFRTAADASRALVYEVELPSGVVQGIHGLERVLGISINPDALTSAWWHARIHPDDLGRHLAELDELIAHGSSDSTFYRLRHADGSWRYVEDNRRVIRDGRGAATRLVGAVVDVTERRRAEESLRDSEARFRALFSSIDEGYCLAEMIRDSAGHPVDYRFLEVNHLFESMTGLTDAVGRTAHELVPNLEQHWVETYAGVALGGEPLRFENGSEAMGRWFDVFATPVEPLGRFALVFKDITERRRAELAVRESRERLELALNVADMFAFVYEPATGRIRRQGGLERRVGLAEEGSLDELMEHLDAVSREDIQARLLALSPATPVWTAEYRLCASDGSERWIADTARGVFDRSGVLLSLPGVAQDITERKRLERREQEFVAMAAHELRTPLTALKGFVQLLQRREAYDAERVQRIVDQADRLNRLVTDLLDASRVASGHLELRPRPTDLVELLRKSVEEIQASSPRHMIRLDIPESPVMGTWDPERLEQVTHNLLGNAVKYSPEGGEILVTLRSSSSEVELTVRDRGRGIPPAALPRLFDRFYRVDEAALTAQGMGLGLHITRSFVEAHGGTIRAESAGLGHGAAFIVALPA